MVVNFLVATLFVCHAFCLPRMYELGTNNSSLIRAFVATFFNSCICGNVFQFVHSWQRFFNSSSIRAFVATFFQFVANVYKIIPELVESWAKVLSNIPNSILLLYPFAPSWSNSYPKEPFVKHLQLILEKYNVKAERLVIVESLATRADVKECLKLVDVYLDSYPYTGSNSNVDPLELGLPVIVIEGNSMRTRQGAAILRSIGLDDLVVQDEESYINLAVKLGTDEKLRSQCREQILEKMANNPPFLDSRSYSAQIGDILKQLFEKHL